MNRLLRKILSFGLFSLFPVRVRRGLAKGAWWTLFPFSAYWRLGGGNPEIDSLILKYACLTGTVAWDLGAHFGIYTVGIARQVGVTGQVVAFEPDAVSRKRLEFHVAQNKLKNVIVIGAAASSTSREGVLLQYHGFGRTDSHLAFPGENSDEASHQEPIECVAVDDLVADGRIRLPQWVKIDVEGHGDSALAGMLNSLSKSRPVILMAFHGEQENIQSSALLKELNYGCHGLDGTPCEWPGREFFGDLLLLPA